MKPHARPLHWWERSIRVLDEPLSLAQLALAAACGVALAVALWVGVVVAVAIGAPE